MISLLVFQSFAWKNDRTYGMPVKSINFGIGWQNGQSLSHTWVQFFDVTIVSCYYVRYSIGSLHTWRGHCWDWCTFSSTFSITVSATANCETATSLSVSTSDAKRQLSITVSATADCDSVCDDTSPTMSRSNTNTGKFLYCCGRQSQPKSRTTDGMCLRGEKFLSQSLHWQDGTVPDMTTSYCLSLLRTQNLSVETTVTCDGPMSSTHGGCRRMQWLTNRVGRLRRNSSTLSLYARTVSRHLTLV